MTTNKHPHTALSTIKCVRCAKLLKANLIKKLPKAGLCYKCYRISIGKSVKHNYPRLHAVKPINTIKNH